MEKVILIGSTTAFIILIITLVLVFIYIFIHKSHMRKKELWMFKGASVLADGKKGTITKMETNSIDNIIYVYYIYVKLEGAKNAGPYHPADIQQLIEETA